MERKLVRLHGSDVEEIVPIGEDGLVVIRTDLLSTTIGRELGMLGLRVAVASIEYLQHDDGAAEPGTRTASGMWWRSHGDDTADIGGFVIEGQALSLIPEGTGESPWVEDEVIIERATRAIASQHEGAEYVAPGLFRLAMRPQGKQAKVFVTRDHRLRRPEDLLEPQDVGALNERALALVIVQLIGGGKALVVTHGM